MRGCGAVDASLPASCLEHRLHFTSTPPGRSGRATSGLRQPADDKSATVPSPLGRPTPPTLGAGGIRNKAKNELTTISSTEPEGSVVGK
ncbi:hypothetical protein ZHAS_00003055 [Anopheles sinensis]|uniref:Uncharacterized protein n=1 Tax=Anopheles sinensis TaxID=74873 RepID=A0A084VDJ1_ANOSI|nr:hypothetical protein ZHAS_00003055 [Anopheles sinensis]